ncbi:hypothetical protein [Streptomyces sp. NBC_00892]|nr:hypothetical protein [Streptomyces sp. NBC_00892]MCX4902513.1 hypothetical protein [Streptomyces sp. NBC_00892]
MTPPEVVIASTGLLGALAVTYMVSPAAQPPVITVTAIRAPKAA